MKKRWYDYLWIASSVYFLLGFVLDKTIALLMDNAVEK